MTQNYYCQACQKEITAQDRVLNAGYCDDCVNAAITEALADEDEDEE